MTKFKILKYFLVILCGVFSAGGAAHASSERVQSDLIVLCYHDIPKQVWGDTFAVDQETFVNTIEYLRLHGFHFVSLQDVIDAEDNIKPLPAKPVLLTFDDAYASYYDFVVPVLNEYKIPSVLGVVSGWLDKKPSEIKQKLMTWKQVAEVSKSDLVEIASHTHQLHQGVIYNPQGNEDAAAVALFFDKKTRNYEDEKKYQERVSRDVLKSKEEIEKNIGKKIRAIAWPYGKYNAITQDIAQKAGIEVNLSLNDKRSRVRDSNVIERFLVYKNPDLGYLLRFLNIKPDEPQGQRVMQLDLDMIYDEDPQQVEKNLGAVLDRVKEMKVTTIYLQAFADPEGNGNVKSVYFPNKVLPVRMDLFNRVVHQLRSRCLVEVYAWMPMLSVILPDAAKTKELRVRKYDHGEIVESADPYKRLSPFSKEVWEELYSLYSDMAKNASIDGVLFQDDGYLTDREDFHPDGLKEYLKIAGNQLKDSEDLTEQENQLWTDRKTEQLIALSEHLKKAVRYYRPEARFARNVYASVLLDPSSESWFAQNYPKTLEAYDYTVVMVYPYLDRVKGNFKGWFKRLVDAAQAYPQGIEKTVFKVQTFDWRRKKWLNPKMVNGWLSDLVGDGAHHLAYYPDDFVKDRPRASVIRMMMSIEDYPFQRE